MPVFSEAIRRLNAASWRQKSMLPAQLREALDRYVDASPTSAQQFAVIQEDELDSDFEIQRQCNV